MLRLIHQQTAQGPILLKDIDDGIPNKTTKDGIASGALLLGLSATPGDPTYQGNPHKHRLDGSSLGGTDKSVSPGINYPKQRCYVPRRKIVDPTIAGYIDLAESDRVLMSQAQGDIHGFVAGGFITVTSFTAADVVAPVITTARIDSPTAGKLTIVGTDLTSLLPDISKVYITDTSWSGTVALTATQITGAGGTFNATTITIPASLLPVVTVSLTSVQVWSDNQVSAVAPVTSLVAGPTLAAGAAVLSAGTGDLALVGTNYTSSAPDTTTLIFTRAGAVVLTVAQADLTIGGGGTTIDVDTLIIPGIIVGDYVQVRANNQLSVSRAIVGGP